MFKVWRDCSCCFANNLEVMEDPGLNQFVAVKGSAPPCGILFDSFDGFLNVEQPLAVISHSGTASRSTRSRMRGRSPCSVTTSTAQPSSSCNSMSEPHVIFGHDDDTLGPAGTDEWMAFVRDSEGNLVGLVEQRTRS